ncbi:uncharacterized protein [Atheta coriaria]|uniref:uncharacterized protein n=1 Tax=Dalotia coriaria TaxID=877792 RepID=UPI0031F354FF
MTITVAMALSGLEPEQWNDGLKEIYMQGAILFPKSPSSLSLASSGASSYYSLESGISSMSPDSASYNQFLLNDLDVLGLDGIIQVQDINDDNIHNTPRDDVTKLGEKPACETTLEESNNEYASPSSRALNEQQHQEDLIASIEALAEEDSTPKIKPNKVYSQVMYGKRNVLNLAANISFGGWQYQPAALPDSINRFYFENRSQYSRLQDAFPPKHTKMTCRDKDCGFVETSYF